MDIKKAVDHITDPDDLHRTTYYVWRRSDGYVNASAYKPLNYLTSTFEILLETTEWSLAYDRIIEERKNSDYDYSQD